MLPQLEGMPVKIVVPTSLQMGWLKSLRYFEVASETAQDVGQIYAQAPIGSFPVLKFETYTTVHEDYKCLPTTVSQYDGLNRGFEVFVYNFIGVMAPSSQ